MDYLNECGEIFRTLASRHDEMQVIDGTRPIVDIAQELLMTVVDGPVKDRLCRKPWGCDDPILCVWRLADACDWITFRRRIEA